MNTMFHSHLQNLVNEYGIESAKEACKDGRFLTQLYDLYIDKNWDVVLEKHMDSFYELKGAVREHMRNQHDCNVESERIMNSTFGGIFTNTLTQGIMEDFEGYWAEGDVIPASDYRVTIIEDCAGDCGVCLSCQQAESEIESHDWKESA